MDEERPSSYPCCSSCSLCCLPFLCTCTGTSVARKRHTCYRHHSRNTKKKKETNSSIVTAATVVTSNSCKTCKNINTFTNTSPRCLNYEVKKEITLLEKEEMKTPQNIMTQNKERNKKCNNERVNINSNVFDNTTSFFYEQNILQFELDFINILKPYIAQEFHEEEIERFLYKIIIQHRLSHYIHHPVLLLFS